MRHDGPPRAACTVTLLAGKVKKSKAKKSKAKGSSGEQPQLFSHERKAPRDKTTVRAETGRLWDIVNKGTATPKKLASLLRGGADLHRRDAEGYSLLHVACRGGAAENVVSALIGAGADVHAVGGGGKAQPIHLAALGNHAETVEALLANGAAVDATDEGTVGAAPLHFAANAGAHAVIDVLLRHNAALDLQSRDGRSVLQFASFCADPTVAERLLTAGAPPLPRSEPWDRERPPLQVLGQFAQYTEVMPRVEMMQQQQKQQQEEQGAASSSPRIFAAHELLHFDEYDGADPKGPAGLMLHRFVVNDDVTRGSSRPADSLDEAIVGAATSMRAEGGGASSAGALRSNQGGFHSAATLRGHAEDPNRPCWEELHTILDAAASLALKAEVAAGRLPAPPPATAAGTVQVTDSWVNVNKGRGDFNELHMHLPAVLSGVYYARTPGHDEQAPLNGAFVLPLTTRGEGGGSGEVTFARMQPQSGELLLFPAGMLHAVLPYWCEDEADAGRISVAFNVSPDW